MKNTTISDLYAEYRANVLQGSQNDNAVSRSVFFAGALMAAKLSLDQPYTPAVVQFELELHLAQTQQFLDNHR